MAKVITRFAPSPTGFLHIGGVRTALFSYLYAKQNDGDFVLRIEDTDRERSKEEWTNQLVDDLKWLGIRSDSFAKQSDRVDIHKKYLKKLVEDGLAYVSKETPKEPGQRDEVIRFKNPNKVVSFEDIVRGDIKVDTTDLGDFVIARSFDEPIFHLAVVVDDSLMGITHVIRAEEHLSNTPRQILIQEAIGAKRPIYAHLPLVLAKDRSKLSKRKHGESVSLTYYKDLGYLPEAIVNFVALMGWNPGDEREIFTIDELIKEFNLEKVQKGGAIFNVEKLDWTNKQHLNKLSDKDFLTKADSFIPKELKEYKDFKNLLPLIRERTNKFSDIGTMLNSGEFDFCFKEPEIDLSKLPWKGENPNDTKEILISLAKVLDELTDFSKESITDSVQNLITSKGKGNVLHPFRYSLSGKDKSPDPFTVSFIIGKNQTIKRLNRAIGML